MRRKGKAVSVSLDKTYPGALKYTAGEPAPEWLLQWQRPSIGLEWHHWLGRNDLNELRTFFRYH